MKNVFWAALTALYFIVTLPAGAQNLKPTLWSAYGISFKVPAGLTVEEDSEESYILSNDTYYVSVQMLDGEPINKEALAVEIKHVATDDQLTQQTPVQSFELPHFYGAQLQGMLENEYYLYNYLMAKDESSGFFVSVICKQKEDPIPSAIIKSFLLED